MKRGNLSKVYWINYSCRDEIIFSGSIHEINHFVLFEKWKAIHGYESSKEPMHPEPLWFLEEIAVDPTLNEKSIQEIAPYEQKAYKQFYTEKINGVTVIDRIRSIYDNSSNIVEFLDKSYDFISKNIDELIAKCG